MKIITPRWSCELAPAVNVVKLDQEPLPLWGWWRLPGCRDPIGTLELRALCRRRGWLLIETEFRQAREVVGDEWTPQAGMSSLQNIYCVPALSRYT